MSSPGALGWADLTECHASKTYSENRLLFGKEIWLRVIFIFLMKYPLSELLPSAFHWPQAHLWLSQGTSAHCHPRERARNHWQWRLNNIIESNFAKLKPFGVSSVIWMQKLLLTFVSKTNLEQRCLCGKMPVCEILWGTRFDWVIPQGTQQWRKWLESINNFEV